MERAVLKLTSVHGRRGDCAGAIGRRLGYNYIPHDTVPRELGFEYSVQWGLNIEEGKNAGDIQENGSKSEESARAYPAKGEARWRFSPAE